MHGWDRARRDPFVHAAVAYVVYGLVYLGGAIARLTPDRKVTHWGFMPWWAFYVLGALLVVALPWAVLRWRPWAARILALGPASKALVLCMRIGQGRGSAFDVGFAGIAVVAALVLARAGLSERIDAATRQR